jgi:hypothetical protein
MLCYSAPVMPSANRNPRVGAINSLAALGMSKARCLKVHSLLLVLQVRRFADVAIMREPVRQMGAGFAVYSAKLDCASMTGFKSFDNAAITIAGIEPAHRINKGQFSFGVGRPRRERSLKVLWERALA